MQHRPQGCKVCGQTSNWLWHQRDLGAEIEEIEADLTRAQVAAIAARERAEADRLLLSVLNDLEEQVREQREAPFVDACGRYLSLAFSRPGSIAINDERRLGTIDRRAAGLGTHAFAALSMGAQELVAMAVHCAMAEVLALESPDHCLPLILDDALTDVDPERFTQAGLILAEAAAHGVQIIFSTCDHRRAHSLGASKVIGLQRSLAKAADHPSATTPSPAAPDTGDDHQTFLTALHTLGGEASARALRSQLKWETDRFNEVRNALLQQGSIEQPPGTKTLHLVVDGDD